MKGIGFILLTLFLGLLFLTTPLPASISAGRPLIVLLILIYWALYYPEKIGVATAWVVGLFTDFLYGIILGPYALGFAISIYLIVRLNARLRMFPIFQLTLFVTMLVALTQLLVIGLGLLLHRMSMTWDVLWSIPTSMICWPIVMIILDSARGLLLPKNPSPYR